MWFLRFLNLLCLPKTIQYIFFTLTFWESNENILVLFCHFFSYFLGKNKLVYSSKIYLSTKVNKSNIKVSRHYWIICLYSKNMLLYFRCQWAFIFLWNMFHSEAIKVCYIFICIQSYPMSSYYVIFIKIHYKRPILYFR